MSASDAPVLEESDDEEEVAVDSPTAWASMGEQVLLQVTALWNQHRNCMTCKIVLSDGHFEFEVRGLGKRSDWYLRANSALMKRTVCEMKGLETYAFRSIADLKRFFKSLSDAAAPEDLVA